jgi:hypothetical protein
MSRYIHTQNVTERDFTNTQGFYGEGGVGVQFEIWKM